MDLGVPTLSGWDLVWNLSSWPTGVFIMLDFVWWDPGVATLQKTVDRVAEVEFCVFLLITLCEKQKMVQVCENNWTRIVGVKGASTSRVDNLGVAVGVKESVKKKLGRSRLK